MRRAAKLIATSLAMAPAILQAATSAPPKAEPTLVETVEDAQRQLRQTFTNLQFEDFGPAPVKGPLYQATAGGRILYFAPQSGHLVFGAVYDRNGVNLTAQAQNTDLAQRLGKLDPDTALVIGPAGARQVIEFTDPDCPYCQALERFWAAKEAEGKSVRRLIYFVSGIHPQAAAKAEHILCSADPTAAFKAMYRGVRPEKLLTCKAGADKIAADARAVTAIGVSGTPTLIVDGKLIAGFQQGELEAFLARPSEADHAQR